MKVLTLAIWAAIAGQTDGAAEPATAPAPAPASRASAPASSGAEAASSTGSSGVSASVPVSTSTSGARFRGAIEASALSFPSGPRDGGQDLFAAAVPILSFDGGEDFGLELGSVLRLRVFDDPPEQRSRDYNGMLRREDWDELSDYGQLLRELRIGSPEGVFHLRSGAFGAYTLGNGQLISRYSNGVNPDYHPAGAKLVTYIGATRTELFASDVLAGRMFAGELTVDLGRVLGTEADWDRYHFATSVVHDFGRAGGTAPGLTLAWLEVDAALLRAEQARITAYLGGGGRVQTDGASLGATLGVSAEGEPRGMRLGGKLELRKQNSGFRQGMVSYDYEIARFSAIGLDAPPLADESLPDSFSVYAEFATALGGDDASSMESAGFVFTAAGEYYVWGRTNLDVSLRGRAFEGNGTIAARLSAVGLGEQPRFLASLETRYRFLPSLYALAGGGTVFFPHTSTGEPGLSRGLFVSLGLGADFAR